LLKGRTVQEEGDWWLDGARLYLFATQVYDHLKGEKANYQPGGAYPYMVEDKAGQVAGHLISLKPELYDSLLVELDWLEGYSETAKAEENEYIRVVREVQQANGTQARAWVYLAAPWAFARRLSQLTPIESGDWLAWRKANPNPEA